ncbi:Tex family protein [Thalassotalea agarivorans]|uniref:S1 motif domain-containing protein n=1 Tax=Thalassotalea agarivorans TaxID=349064 RepID=A0A1I0CLR2_THASX|nr:Tex family protein [Thalassotalea agarivorans]SET19916.1 uncharacterized protein SAMN05660429_01225 [Thalassotalea agarivorans]
MQSIVDIIAQELSVSSNQVNAAVALIDDGATVPFIARYRKEVTGGLDDGHLRHLSQRLTYLRELEDRRQVVLASIEQQGKLTAELKADIEAADNKTRLEDLYLPYKPKRRTKGQIAIEAGIEPLADALLDNWNLDPELEGQSYLNKEAGFEDVKSVLDGACFILMERFAEDANLLQKLRKHLLGQSHLTSTVAPGKEAEASKYQDYFAHSERLANVPSHRALAMLRGRNEGLLQLSIDVDPGDDNKLYSSSEGIISNHFGLNLSDQTAAAFLNKVVRWTWKVKLSLSLETELLGQMREQAETDAIKVFSTNLSDLLMAAPAGAKVTLGLDPGFRTGCKLAVVDNTGKLLHTGTIFPHQPQGHWDKAIRTLVNIFQQFNVELVAIGNGTASRESDKLVGEAIKASASIKPQKLIVSEAGASVYSASEFAAQEFPELDVSIRGAISIARRLQDPLAELVKIDPKAIGVGQYQHDVSQSQLSKTLDDVIEDCVNAVGVDLNIASIPLLTRVSGLNKSMAQNIVNYRDSHGKFENRNDLMSVPRLGPKAFEQAAGFLRISNGSNPLDKSGVHPETYPVITKLIEQLNQPIEELLGNKAALRKADITSLTTESFGSITVKDVIAELEKPGRDPRPAFKTAEFKEGVEKISDLKPGMTLEGVISNVANFGAFVDIGVHQDGLVHISSLTNKFVSDPREVVKAGDIVKVKVLEVDVHRKRISLTMRMDEEVRMQKQPSARTKKVQKASNKQGSTKSANAAMGNAFADAFAKLKK